MKILVTYASAGAGHRKAAEYVAEEFSRHDPWDVCLMDALDQTSPLYKRLYAGVYTFLITHVPAVWGVFFALAGIKTCQGLCRVLRRILNQVNGWRFERFLEQEQFDAVISTHFFPSEVTAALKRQGRIQTRLLTVITDYDVHPIWLAKGTDLYAVATPWTAERLRGWDAESSVEVTGIPVDSRFRLPEDKSPIRRALGLDPEHRTVLVATGSFGIGPIEELVRRLKDWQVLVVCGHNQGLFQRLSEAKQPLVKVMGLVDNMHELMGAADVFVTKPGGLSITEALACGLPMIFFHAIPGQETQNVKVLRQYGVGEMPGSCEAIVERLQSYAAAPEKLADLQNKARALARPDAVHRIRESLSRSLTRSSTP